MLTSLFKFGQFCIKHIKIPWAKWFQVIFAYVEFQILKNFAQTLPVLTATAWGLHGENTGVHPIRTLRSRMFENPAWGDGEGSGWGRNADLTRCFWNALKLLSSGVRLLPFFDFNLGLRSTRIQKSILSLWVVVLQNVQNEYWAETMVRA